MNYEREGRMKIYIASKYIKHSTINKEITQLLIQNGFDVFLPEVVNVNATTPEERAFIGFKCYDEIETSDVLLIIAPYKRSVSAEIGYAINNKIKHNNIIIVLFRYTNEDKEEEEGESMIVPYLDYTIESYASGDTKGAFDNLISYLNIHKNNRTEAHKI